VRIESIVATGTPAELLAADAETPMLRLAEHPIWCDALAGKLPPAELRALIVRLYPVIGGPGRYMTFAKVSQIDRGDGEQLFRDLYEASHEPRADADAGWRRLARGLGITDAALDAARDTPSPEAEDLIAVYREHSLKTSPAAAAAVAWALERQLPPLWGALADALARHYGVAAEALDYLRFQAGRANAIADWVQSLVVRYFLTADPLAVYEARRAAREIAWCWTALTEGGP